MTNCYYIKPIRLFYLVLIYAGLGHFPLNTQAQVLTTIQTQIFTDVTSQQASITSNDNFSVHWFDKKSASYPLTLNFKGPLGGIYKRTFATEKDVTPLIINPVIIKNKHTHPETIAGPPMLCPRIRLNEKSKIPLYLGEHDRLNIWPSMQLLDPDIKKGLQYKVYTEKSKTNILALKKVVVSNDYEDSRILDYSGPNPLTGKHQDIYEGNGGFYANIHYAIVPYEKRITKLDSQTILHLAQGKLLEIDATELTPKLRAHSFIPGPFLSKEGIFYDMCEWGDTSYQAPRQELEYQNIFLWNWNYSIPKTDRILLIVWEGDEEEWMINEQLISPFTLTDDLIGVFEIRRKDTIKPLTLKNEKGDFEITIQTVE